MLPYLLEQLPSDEVLLSVRGDGAYDTKGCHEAIAQRKAQAIIPCRKRVMARNFESQVVELQIRAAILNRFTRLGTPTTVRVA